MTKHFPPYTLLICAKYNYKDQSTIYVVFVNETGEGKVTCYYLNYEIQHCNIKDSPQGKYWIVNFT